VALSGLVGDAGGTAVGAIDVNYTHGLRCRLTPDADALLVVTGNIATLSNWASDDLGTGGCAESADVDVTLVAGLAKFRGSIVLDINPGSQTPDVGELGLPTPLPIWGGKVVVVDL
jgi:hypothetical protein